MKELMTTSEVVKKLVGEIHPVGESHIDNKRFENLKEMCELVDVLLHEINLISNYKGRPEHSMKKAGEYADEFLTEMANWISE